jgi:NAD(P)-dependent dehydrogenase (short-subunit alcohol dehydrogenase family)
MSTSAPATESVPASLHDQTVVVTGASDGVGKAASRAFAGAGAQVVMLGRNDAKTAAAARAIMSETGSRRVSWYIADLAVPEAVHEVAAQIRRDHPRIRVLANNAGALFMERQHDRDGLERTFALNHLSYVGLTLALLPALHDAADAAEPARVINVASRAHQNARPQLADLQATRSYRGWRAYANSKLFNLWFTDALSRRVDPTRIVVHAMHPGVVRTRFATNNGRVGRFLRWVMDLNSVTPEQGADTLVWLASAAEARTTSGTYWVKRRPVTPSRLARDRAQSEALWTQSLALLHLEEARLPGLTARADVTH